jgi:hypothetical protein
MLGHTDRNSSPEIELSNPDSKQLTVMEFGAATLFHLVHDPNRQLN